MEYRSTMSKKKIILNAGLLNSVTVALVTNETGKLVLKRNLYCLSLYRRCYTTLLFRVYYQLSIIRSLFVSCLNRDIYDQSYVRICQLLQNISTGGYFHQHFKGMILLTFKSRVSVDEQRPYLLKKGLEVIILLDLGHS